MKRIISLFVSITLVAVLMCGCAQEAKDGIKNAASSVSSDVNSLRQNQDNGLNNEATSPTVVFDPTEVESILDEMATEWQDMVDDGTVEDGDGNVGDLENNDGDGNTDSENDSNDTDE